MMVNFRLRVKGRKIKYASTFTEGELPNFIEGEKKMHQLLLKVKYQLRVDGRTNSIILTQKRK